MKIENSESAKRVYPMKQILKATGLSSAAFYRKKPAGNEKARPGSKPGISDEVLLVEIREILKCIFVDEGCEKIWKRLKRRGVRASKDRINQVMRENNLLSVDEIMAWHICKIGDRFAAMEPLKMAVKKTYGTLDRDICQGAGLFLRSDHGSQ